MSYKGLCMCVVSCNWTQVINHHTSTILACRSRRPSIHIHCPKDCESEADWRCCLVRSTEINTHKSHAVSAMQVFQQYKMCVPDVRHDRNQIKSNAEYSRVIKTDMECLPFEKRNENNNDKNTKIENHWAIPIQSPWRHSAGWGASTIVGRICGTVEF